MIWFRWGIVSVSIALLIIIWLYVAARVVTRGILRTIHERRSNNEQKKKN